MDVKKREVVTKTIIPQGSLELPNGDSKPPNNERCQTMSERKNSMTGGDKRDIADSGFQTGVEKKCILG